MKNKRILFWLCCLTLGVPTATVSAADIAYLGLDTQSTWQVWIMESDGADARQVTDTPHDKVRVSWYPDGRRLLVNAIDGFAYRVDLDSGRETRIDTELQGFQDAVLSPDGERFVFSLSTAGSVDANNLWLVNEDGSDLHRLTTMPWLQHEPVWSPDGNAIYFLSGAGGQTHDIWRVELDHPEPRQVTGRQVYHFDVAVAADGTLAYSNNRDGHYDLWLRTPAGEERRLTESTALDARPSWSPDGDRLAFESSRDGGPDIWLLEIASGKLTRLTDTGGSARFPVWRIGGGAQ